VRALARRAHSTAELRRKLRRRAAAPAEVEPLLARLSQRGWLDDRRFARAYARTRSQYRRYGRQRIERELRQRGVDPELIAAALAEAFAEEGEERTLVRQRLERRLRGAQRPYSMRFLRSVYASLLRAGFPSAIIRDELFSRARFGRAGGALEEEFEAADDEPE